MARSILSFLTVATVLAVGSVADGQYVVEKVGRADGDPSGATVAGTELDNVTRPALSTNGLIAFKGDTTETTDDDVIYVGDVLIVESGIVAAGAVGANPGFDVEFDTLDTFQTTAQVNATGDVVFTSTMQNLPTTQNTGLHVNNSLVFQEGDTAPGLVDVRLFVDFAYAGLLDDGRVGFRADLDGATDDDFVIYFDGLPLQANATTIFRESEIIVGGPLDGEQWEDATAFGDIDWNNNGDAIIDAQLEAAADLDDVLIIKRAGFDYEAPLRAGDLITVPTGTFALESISDVAIADNGDWVIEAVIDTATAEDNVVIASFAGGAPEVLIQEDADAELITGVPLTQIGFISGIAINNNGEVAIHCGLDDDPTNPVDYSEGVLLYSGGAFTLVTTDEISIPNGFMTDILGPTTMLADDGTVIFEATVDGLDGIYQATVPSTFPVSNLSCELVAGTVDASLTWDLPQAYTAIRVVVDGVAQTPDLPGTAIDTLVTGLADGVEHEICIIGIDGADEALPVCCNVAVPLDPDLLACSTPGSAILDQTTITDVLTVVGAINIADMYVEIDITHTFVDDLDPLSITSPFGTTVTLMADDGGSADDVHAYFSDAGVPSDSVPYSDDRLIQPSGPGTLADFYCESVAGDWTLTVGDDAGGDEGTLDNWCLGFVAQANPALDCCPRPTDLTCGSNGPCGGGGITVNWTNNSTYFSLDLIRDDGLGGVVTFPLGAADTSFLDTTTVFGTEYTYTIEYVCASGGATNEGPSCVITPENVVPTVTDLVCAPDFCANEVVVTWNNNGIAYDSLTLNRAGLFLADVTGLTSFVDTTPSTGTAAYQIVADCGGVTAAETCVADLVFQPASDLICASDLVTGEISISWTNNASYDTVELRRNGALVSPQPAPGDTSYVDPAPVAGCNTYELTTGCAGMTAALECSLASFVPGNAYLMIPESTDDTVGLYDPDCGAYVGDLIVDDGVAPFTLSTPISAVLGPDGNIYVSDQLEDNVTRFDIDGNFIDVFATTGLDNVRGIDFEVATGNLLVADNDYVAAFDPAGLVLPIAIDNVDAFDVIALADGRNIVNEISVDEVRLYETDGVTFTVLVSGLSFPEQSVPLPNGNFAVVDFTDDTITEFDLAGTIVQTIPIESGPRGAYPLT
ncbi:MAG: proprotein convertase P-domain-containing protein, partial [Planctomycetota bacterium]